MVKLLKAILAICGTAATITYVVITGSNGQSIAALFAFLSGLAIGSIKEA